MKITSMKGLPVDFTRFLAQNEKTIAVGNAGLNARGDELGRNGKVVRKREEIAAEYHSRNPKAVKQVSLKDLPDEIFQSPADAVAAYTGKPQAGQTKPTPSMTQAPAPALAQPQAQAQAPAPAPVVEPEKVQVEMTEVVAKTSKKKIEETDE